jgi:hypothetical protein
MTDKPGLKAIDVSRERRKRFRVWMFLTTCVTALLVGAFVVRIGNRKTDASNAAASASANVPLVPPIIKITETTIFVDDREVAKTDTIASGTRIQRIDGLFTELKRIQESRRNVAGLPQHQTVIIDAAWNVAAIVVKSVFQTASYAGFDDVEFKLGDGGLLRP